MVAFRSTRYNSSPAVYAATHRIFSTKEHAKLNPLSRRQIPTSQSSQIGAPMWDKECSRCGIKNVQKKGKCNTRKSNAEKTIKAFKIREIIRQDKLLLSAFRDSVTL